MVETSDADALPPISDEEPCGPDLDLNGDSDFMNFMAATEGLLPAAYFSFDRKTIDFGATFATAAALQARTQDLRLLVLEAKLAILNRDLAGFAHRIGAIAWLLVHRWDDVHPRAEEGDYSARLVHLGTLDDGPVVILPLQYAPLIETRRDGAIAFRSRLVALGEVNAREGENLASASTTERVLATVELETLAAAYEALQRLQANLTTITSVTAERVGYEAAVRFKALTPLVERMAAYLREALAKRDPGMVETAAGEDGAAADSAQSDAAATPSSFTTLSEVDSALGAALGYFAAFEPSSPARLLIGQARETLGKNLYEVMQLLAPGHADAARVFVGPDNAFTVPVSSLAGVAGAGHTQAEATPAPSRAAALALIDSAASHLRRAEPSSPAPYLLDRAKALATRDFLSLLHDLLPEDDLSSMKNGR